MTDSVFCLYDPWPTTIPLTRPATGSDGIFSLVDDHIAYSRTTVEWMSYVGQHMLHIISIGGSTKMNTKILRIACKSGWWCVPLILFAVNDRTSMTEWKHYNISTSEEGIERRLNWEESSTLGSARCRFKRLRRVESKFEIKRRWQREATSIFERCFLNPGFGNATNIAGVEIKPNVPLAWGMSSPEKLLVPKKNH